MIIAYSEKINQSNVNYDKLVNPSTSDVVSLIQRMNSGDTLIVDDIVTIADCTRSIYKILKLLSDKHIFLYCIKQNIHSNHRDGNTLINVILGLYEQDILRHKTLTVNGMKKSLNKGGRPRTPEEKLQLAIAEYNKHEKAVKDILAENGISSAVFYRALKNNKNNQIK